MNKDVVLSLIAGLVSGELAIAGREIASGMVHLPGPAIDPVLFLLAFAVACLSPSVLKALLGRDIPAPPDVPHG